jgi:hypothetical protein
LSTDENSAIADRRRILKDVRDRALLLIGFAGGLRRLELIVIDCTDIERVRQGVVITRCQMSAWPFR